MYLSHIDNQHLQNHLPYKKEIFVLNRPYSLLQRVYSGISYPLPKHHWGEEYIPMCRHSLRQRGVHLYLCLMLNHIYSKY